MKLEPKTFQQTLYSLQRSELTFLLAAFIYLLFPTTSPAQEFTARSLGDYGNVSVMEVNGNYDAYSQAGSINSAPREAIAKEFFKTHKDEYDFLVIFTNFDFLMPDDGNAKGFYLSIKNNAQGIGQEVFDNSSLFGSIGRLQGAIEMGNISTIVTDPLDPKFEDTLYMLNHEFMHRWAAYLKFKDSSGNLSNALHGKDGIHWSYLLGSGSVLYGNQWQDNGNATFTSLGEGKSFSPLDLYLMGMIDKSKVPPMLLIDNPNIDPAKRSQPGETISGAARYVTIDDIIAVNGPRTPDAASSQKNFKTAFILVTTPGTFTGHEIYGIENIRNGFVTRHSILTDGQSIVEVASTPKEDVPENPGVLPPSITPRTLPPDINQGMAWLMANQKPEGNWSDLAETVERDTAETVLTLKNFTEAQTSYTAGLQWLALSTSGNTDFLARKIEAYAAGGLDLSGLVTELLSRRNSDNGWGSDKNYASNSADTAIALKALAVAGYADQTILANAIGYLKSHQKPDGGWTGNGESTIQATANALLAFSKYRKAYALEDSIANAIAWLLTKQNTDGGFGNSPSTVYDTALALLALREMNTSTDITNKAAEYLLSQQAENGSWNNSAYQTALAVHAVYISTVDPDLSIKSADIRFIPGSVTSLPANIVIEARIWNTGSTAVPQARVVLYEGDPSASSGQAKLGEQTVAFPGQQATTVTFSTTIRDGNEHRYYIVVDPENLVKESSEVNNSAVSVIRPEATYDFEVLASDITVLPNPVDQLQDVKIMAKITNRGTMNAYNVQVKYFIDEAGNPYELGTMTIDVPANNTVTKEVTWRANRMGTNLPVAVLADPFDNFAELSETNNKASLSLTVNPVNLIDPNLTVSYQDIIIAPTPAKERGNVHISALVKNEGYSPASNITVNIYHGVPGPNGLLLGTRTIPSIGEGESAMVSVDWKDIQESGEEIIYVQVDPDNLVQEIREDDNEVFVTLQVHSLPDLTISDSSISFSPPAPKTDENVLIGVSVQNKGDQSASNVVVRVLEGGVLIGSQAISSLSGNSVTTAVFSYDTTGKTGAHHITFTVDPDNTIIEQNENNNSASKTFGVQDASLWLTEQYISPNGDGVKDSTQLFFTLDMQQSVRIDVVSGKGEIVRSFAGPEFENTTAGNITWDGLDDKGMVVDDGQYKIQVKTTAGVLVKEILCVVDNNNTSLVDALNAGTLSKNDLSCMMPDEPTNYPYFYYQNAFDSTRMWLPDGSGVMYYIHYYTNGGQSYTKYAGLYVMSPDGKNTRKMLENWLIEDKKFRNLQSFSISPDGQKVAVLARRTMCQYPFYSCNSSRSELWMMDINGNSLKLLDSIDINSSAKTGASIVGDSSYFQDIKMLKWSPDNKSLAYFVKRWDNTTSPTVQGKDIYVVNVETGVKIKMHSQSLAYTGTGDNYVNLGYEWSQDGNRLAVLLNWGYSQYRHARWTDYYDYSELWSISKDGNPKKLMISGYQNYPDYRGYCNYTGDYVYASLFNQYARWVDDSQVALNVSRNCGGYTSISLLNAETNDIVQIGNKTSFVVSSDNKKIAYADEDTKNVIVYDVLTSAAKHIPFGPDYVLHDNVDGKWGNVIEFSPDGRRIAFSLYKSYAQEGQNKFVIVDIESLAMRVIDAQGLGNFDGVKGISWTPGGKHLLVAAMQKSTELPVALYLVDVSSGEKRFFSYGGLTHASYNNSSGTPVERLFYIPSNNNYLAFSAYATTDSSSGCVQKGNAQKIYSLWTASASMNLSATLLPLKDREQVYLNGTASDINFQGYKLEYAALNALDQWYPIVPFSDVPVLNGTFATWIPPAEGTFHVKLTVWDKAGNIAETIKKISWGQLSAITGIYKDYEIFSPNGDGVKDTVSIHYTVADPSHFEVKVVDMQDNPVRTFQKDYAVPIEDSIAWDGQDESGNVVPDGKYKVKVSGFEFFVVVDTTPPDVHVALTPMMPQMRQDGSQSVVDYYYVNLTGRANDQNIKGWVVEQGEGYNPQEWTQVARGEGSLAKKDQNNRTITPVEAAVISTYKNDDMASLAGKKYRITAEDSAGNKTATTSDLLEGSVLLYSWDGAFISNSLKPEQAKPGLHQLGGLETIALPLTQISVQYGRNGQWVETSPVAGPSTGLINLQWDNSALGQDQVYAVRLKTVDLLGQVRYSNQLAAGTAFRLNKGCGSVYADVYLPEDLISLKLQIRSSNDVRYVQWTDYRSYDSAVGDTIPTGSFFVTPSDSKPGAKYDIRMVGTNAAGYEYNTVVYDYPSLCPITMDLEVNATERDCGLLSNEAGLFARLKLTGSSSGIALQSLKYYLHKPEGAQLLKDIDLSVGGVEGVVINTASLAEGNYTVEAVLAYKNSNIPDVVSASGVVVVDRVLPMAQIIYPGNALMSCPVQVVNAKGDWVGMPIEGTITDSGTIQRYELYYDIGETPSFWHPAMTRVGDQTMQITGKTAVNGQIGNWDFAGLAGTSFSLKLLAVDSAGNVSCSTTGFSVDHMVEISSVTADKYRFSPNGDGLFDDAHVGYQIDENVGVDVKVFKLLQTASGHQLDSAPVRIISTGLRHLGGAGSSTWDGRDDSGAVVPDGTYAVAVTANDSCRNSSTKWVAVEVSTAQPAAAIAYPQSGDALPGIVEVRGTAAAEQFQKYVLEAGQGDNPTAWEPVSSGTSPVKNGILGTWNVAGLTGTWILRLSVSDTAGNKNTAQVSVNLTIVGNLIKGINSPVTLISPNNDGKYDDATITYEVADTCNVKLEISDAAGNVKWSNVTGTQTAGIYSQRWDGKDNAGVVVSDGAYKIGLTANLAADQSVAQSEAITITVDTTPPAIDIKQPTDGGSVSGDLTVSGAISDVNLQEYSITYNGTAGVVALDQGNQSRTNYVFGIINGLPEGSYSITARAKDAGENIAEKSLTFTVDRTAPVVALATPKTGEFFGADTNIVNITGSVAENNLESYAIRYGAGDNPVSWTTLASGSTLPAGPQLFEWAIGKNSGVLDGLYTLSLYAKDKAGLAAEAKVKVIIDNTAPWATIIAPQPESYVISAVDIKGTSYDQNLDKYILDLSEGNCQDAFKWSQLKSAEISVSDGTLSPWEALPSDGRYCLRLTVRDKAGNVAESKVSINVDTHPPAAPFFTAIAENKSDARLSWTDNAEPDLAGYNVYRNGQKVNATLLPGTVYLDQNLAEGVYAYTVKAVDVAGGESTLSTVVKVVIDRTGPDVNVSSPQDGTRVGGIVEIKGTAYSSDDFKQYRVYSGQGANPASWNLLRTSPVPVLSGSLAQWNAYGLDEGQTYSLKIEGEDIVGNINTRQMKIVIDNTPPAAPVLLSATANGSDVVLTWNANVESDLAGYLLYRNDQIANGTSGVIGDLKPYLLSGTTYLDQSRPDGTFNFNLVALDRAGNVSGQSNSIALTIDAHAPRASIVEPGDKSKTESKIKILSESADLDIASIQFQYKKASDTVWKVLGSPVIVSPYFIYFDPSALGLSYADYHLRAKATDDSGKTDSSPPSITVTYTDLTAPTAPAGLKATVNAKNIALTWFANTETDISGYNIYRLSGSWKKLNSALITSQMYQISNLEDGTYSYRITAVDKVGNESTPTSEISGKVYAPVIIQPAAVTTGNTVQIAGSNAAQSSTVEAFVATDAGAIVRGSTISDESGNFVVDVALGLGQNKATVRVTDASGNVSRLSNEVLVIRDDAPAQPSGLFASVQGYDVDLTWNPNGEPDWLGYNVYRNASKINGSSAVTTGTIAASSTTSSCSCSALNAFDGDSSTYWQHDYRYGGFTPQWWEISLPATELINRIEIDWHAPYVASGFQIQFWNGFSWITYASRSGNNQSATIIDFASPRGAQKVRIYMTKAYYSQIAISDVRIFKVDVMRQASFKDINVKDGEYAYTVTAVDSYGFESEASEAARVVVGDIIPPAAPIGLTAVSLNSMVLLSWTPNIDAVSGYNIYKLTEQGWKKINSSPSFATTYTDVELKNGTYMYYITAVDAAGNESQPSSQESATVFILLPEAPVSANVTPVNAGKALLVSWQGIGGPVAGYSVYRGLSGGGPYTKINNALIGELSYVDAGLANGIPYYYVVTATDVSGNEGVYSNEAVGIPLDTVAPSKPVILLPVKSGSSVTTYAVETEIAGFAEIGSAVELFESGVSAAVVTAEKKDVMQSFTIGSVYDPAISPDGKMLAYRYNNFIHLRDIASGQTTVTAIQGFRPVWSGDGSRIAYGYYDSSGYSRLGIYNVANGANIPLTNDTSVSEDAPSLSRDGDKIVFISSKGGKNNIWIKDLSANSTTQITDGIYISNPRLSPDGLRIAYFRFSDTTSSWSVHVYEVSDGTTTAVDGYSNNSYLDWSADGKKLAFVSTRAGNGEIFIYDTTKSNLHQFTSSTDYETDPHWSPDEKNITYIKSGNSLWIAPYLSSGQGRQIQTGAFNYLAWLESGDISYISGTNLYFASVEVGYFEFKNMELGPGENTFYVITSDTSGNRSEPSDPISVTYDTSKTPDLTVTVDDIYLYPMYPVSGEQLAVNIAVWNKGYLTASNLNVDVYLWNADGRMELLKSASLSSLAPGSAGNVSAVWDSTGKVGENRLVVVIDPADMVTEIDETNNMAIRDLIVTANEGLALITTLDSTQYASGKNVGIRLTAWNSGIDKNVAFEVQIEDENDYPVAAFDPKSVTLAYGTNQVYEIFWNTGTTYAGNYRVHAVLKDTSGVVGENTVPFIILPDVAIDAALSTNKATYETMEKVTLSCTVKNSGANHIIPAATAKFRITNSSGRVLFTGEKSFVNLLPEAVAALNTDWNTGSSPAGIYSAVVEVYVDSKVIASKSVSFNIGSVVIIAGSVTAIPAVVSVGKVLHAEYNLSNSGNGDAIGFVSQILVVDPDTAEVKTIIRRQELEVRKGEAVSDTVAIATETLDLKTYTLVLQYFDNSVAKTLSTSSFTIKDLLPPAIAVLSPVAGNAYNAALSITATVADDASGVDRAEYRIDEGAWKLLPPADPSSGRYATTWEPALTDNGSHSIAFRATDKAGNTGTPVWISFSIQLDNIAPVTAIDVGTPMYKTTGEHYVSAGTTFGLSASDNFSGVSRTEYRVDEGIWNGYVEPFILSSYAEGEHRIYYRSTDNAGNVENARELKVVLDNTPPVTIITASDPLLDGVVNTVSPSTAFTLNATDNFSGVKSMVYRIDEGPWQLHVGSFSLSGLSAGRHAITYRATDYVLNEEQEKTLTVQLIIFEVIKEIATEPVVLIAAKHGEHNEDDANGERDHRRQATNNLKKIFADNGINHAIVEDNAEFKEKLRSGMFNTYILVDYKKDEIEDELREAIHYGAGLILIKTKSYADPELDEVLGAKFKGKSTEKGLLITLVPSPISDGGTLRIDGERKVVRAEKVSQTTQILGYVEDRRDIEPIILFNQYGRGRAILFGFDLLNCPDQVMAAELVLNSINYVRPDTHPVTALDSVPVKIRVSNSAEPMDIRVTETLPPGIVADTIAPDAIQSAGLMTWEKSLGSAETAMFGYHLSLPEKAGNFKVSTVIRYSNNGEYRLYGDYGLTLTVTDSPADLLQRIIAELNSVAPLSERDAHGINEINKSLSSISEETERKASADRNIARILRAIDEARDLSIDATKIRLKLDELLSIWAKKWYQASISLSLARVKSS